MKRAQRQLDAIDSAFLNSYKLPIERYSKLLTNVCTDVASVNMGVYNGACTQIKKKHNRNWILLIHCSNHRLEFAIKNAFQSDKAFLEIDGMMSQSYYIFMNSGKAKRIFSAIALTLGVTFVSFVKATGTRLQKHKYRASRAMIVNFCHFALILRIW